MRAAVLFAICGILSAQVPDPAYEPLARAYEALRACNYDAAITGFLEAVAVAPGRASIRKDLAYTYLKIGENTLARDQFLEAMKIVPEDTQVALEYAYLCYETQQRQQARRSFDRIRKTAGPPFGPQAEEAFQFIDQPLAEGIERWKQAIALGADDFSVHYELATLAEQRDELELAAVHYERAWRILPDRRSVLVDLGRVWLALDRPAEANAVLLAASRGGEPRAAELARELLPNRYPFVDEFHRALEFDSGNIELRRELGYLLLKIDREPEAEREFQALLEIAPNDLLSATQLGFLFYARGQQALAQPLFDRVLAGKDEDLANRVRAVLQIPQILRQRSPEAPLSIDARIMAERSIKAGYLKDALKYLQVAHEEDPADFHVMLKLGWTYNILHQDAQAIRWFDLARRSPDPRIASEALSSWKNLKRSLERVRVSAWLYPIYSSRWRDLFGYGQAKTELRAGLSFQPYFSVRFVGDSRLALAAASPVPLSESSFVLALGAARTWKRITGWAETGYSIGYRSGHMLPDYRAGVSTARGFGAALRGESTGGFADATLDGVFISRFDKDFLMYQQLRGGYTIELAEFRAQFYWNGNLTFDARGQDWANFVETGPGFRIRQALMPPSMYGSIDLLGGRYLRTVPEGRQRQFRDVRAGLWYAFTH
jgi:Flp pilus assembly protein TadD